MSIHCPCVYMLQLQLQDRLTGTAVRWALSSLLLAGSRTLASIVITMRTVNDTARCGRLARYWSDGHHTIRLIVHEQTRGIGDDVRDNGVESGELGALISGHVQNSTLSPSCHPGIIPDPSDMTNMASVRARASEKEHASLEMGEENTFPAFLPCINNGSRSR